MRFEGYKVLITGATSGIGLATAKRFLDEGATVIGIGRNFEKTKSLGEKFIPYVCDISEVEQIDQAVSFVCDTFGDELDTFVNNAGHGIAGNIKNVSAKDIDTGVDLFLKPAILFGKKLYPLLQKAPSGNASIVNVSSLANRLYDTNNVVYDLCKLALLQYTKIQAAGLEGVRCNCVSPGFIDTPIFGRKGRSREEIDTLFKNVSDTIPTHRIGKPEEVASVITFLCSENAKYISGTDFLVDGGASLRQS